MSTLWTDLLFALRLFRRAKAFYVTVLLLVIGGVGATSAIGGLVRSLMWRPLPFDDADQLSMIWSVREDNDRFKVSLPDFLDWKAQSRSFSHMAVLRDWAFLLNTPGQAPRTLYGLHVSGEYFELLGIRPILGRVLRPEDDRVGGPHVAVLSETTWRGVFGGDPKLIDKTVRLDSFDYRIVGVVPDHAPVTLVGELHGPKVWSPIAISFPNYESTLARLRDDHETHAIVRRKPGVSIDEAQTELSNISRRIAAQHPGHELGVRLADLDDELRGGARRSASVLLLAVGLVFLAICSNVASLLLSRTQSRRGELATRVALGASPGRLVRQLVTESVTLFLMAVPASVLAAAAFSQVFEAFLVIANPKPMIVHIDWGLVLSCSLLCAVAGAACGALPAIAFVDKDLASAVKRSALGHAFSRSHKRLSTGLVAAQIAVALALLCGAGLAAQAFGRLMSVPMGFQGQNVAFTYTLASDRPPEDLEGVTVFYEELLRRIRLLPGVQAASASNTIPPITFEAIQFQIQPESMAPPPAVPRSNFNCCLLEEHTRVTPGYFETLSIPLIAGRDFTPADRRGSRPVIIVSERVERLYFSTSDRGRAHPALGRRVRLYGEKEDREIVGIVGDVRGDAAARVARAEGYLPFAQSPFQGMKILVRNDGRSSIFSDVPRLVRELNPNVAVNGSWWLWQAMGAFVVQRSLASALLLAFSAAALLLSLLGIYSLASQLTLQRTREIGIRLALGAPPVSAAALILRSGARPVLLGLVVGLVSALVVGRLIERYVLAARAFDVWVFVAVPGLVALASLTACSLPALRALRISPALALRNE